MHQTLRKNVFFFISIAILFSAFGSILITPPSHRQPALELSIFPSKTTHGFTQHSNLTVLGVEVDDRLYTAQELLKGGWIPRDDGSLSYLSGQVPEEPLRGVIPEGYKQTVIFQGTMWNGNVTLKYNNTEWDISTYVYGETQNIPFQLSSLRRGVTFTTLYIFGALFVLISMIYAICAALFFRDIDIINVLFKKSKTKSFFIISELLTTIIIASNACSPFISLCCVIGAFPVYLFFEMKERGKRTCSYPHFFWLLIIGGGIFYTRYTFVHLLCVRLKAFHDYAVIIIFLSMIPGLVSIVKGVLNYLYTWLHSFIIEMDYFEKVYFVTMNAVMIILIALIYSHTSAFSTGLIENADGTITRQYADIIYGYDHSWLLDYFSSMDIRIYNIKHPIGYIFVLPFAWAGKLMSRVFFPVFPQIYGFFLAVIHAQCMILCAILLKRITKKPIISLLYSATYFYILLCFGAEQYQISIMLVLLSISQYIVKGKADSKVLLAMSGATLTSGYLVPILTPYKGLKTFAMHLFKYCLMFLGLCCVCGTILAFDPGKIKLLLQPAQYSYGLLEKAKIFTHFVVWNFISPKAQTHISSTGLPVYTSDVPTNFSMLGVVLLGFCVISFIAKRNNKLIKIAGFSVAFSGILCLGLGWAIEEAWLYTILFSWSYLILLYTFLDTFINNARIKRHLLQWTFILILVLNLIQLGDLLSFCTQYYTGLHM